MTPSCLRISATDSPLPFFRPNSEMSCVYDSTLSPVISSTSVVFPVPLAPRTAQFSPSRTVHVSGGWKTTAPPAYRRLTPRISTNARAAPPPAFAAAGGDARTGGRASARRKARTSASIASHGPQRHVPPALPRRSAWVGAGGKSTCRWATIARALRVGRRVSASIAAAREASSSPSSASSRRRRRGGASSARRSCTLRSWPVERTYSGRWRASKSEKAWSSAAAAPVWHAASSAASCGSELSQSYRTVIGERSGKAVWRQSGGRR
mmetsp:Transcript_42277/g.105304  ORF Transcript_42277/g.105304 Transcript_42277/m.105304 type:complete len:266 (-) Transcript_42277:144-941(-)